MSNIKVVIFDWGGVLGHSGKRHIFLYSPTIKQSKTGIKSDIYSTLKALKARGYVIGILSNTQYSREDMNKALRRLNLAKYFSFAIYSSDDFSLIGGPKMCRKPCKQIFETAIKISKEYVPYIRSQNILYVGDDYKKDMVGAKRLGMKTAFLIGSPYSLETDIKTLSKLRYHDIVLRSLSDLLRVLK